MLWCVQCRNIYSNVHEKKNSLIKSDSLGCCCFGIYSILPTKRTFTRALPSSSKYPHTHTHCAVLNTLYCTYYYSSIYVHKGYLLVILHTLKYIMCHMSYVEFNTAHTYTNMYSICSI